MSKFADKAESIKAEGAAKRKEWTPEGAPLNLYNYWLRNSDSKKAKAIRNGERQENFCHFWRVVAIWAPLLWVWSKVERVIDHAAFFPTIFGIIVIGFVLSVIFSEGLPGVLILVTILASVAAALATAVGVSALIDRYPVAAKKVGKVLGKVVGALMGVGAIAVFVWVFGVVGIVLLAVGGILGGVVYFNITRIGEWIERQRERSKAREKIARAARRARYEAYYEEHGYYPYAKPAREPGKVKKFFTGVGDFIIMLAQVARVKKWGVCPIVDIAQEKIDYDSGWETA